MLTSNGERERNKIKKNKIKAKTAREENGIMDNPSCQRPVNLVFI